MDMRFYPMIGFHIRKDLGISVQTARKNDDKNICRDIAAAGDIINIELVACFFVVWGSMAFSTAQFNIERVFYLWISLLATRHDKIVTFIITALVLIYTLVIGCIDDNINWDKRIRKLKEDRMDAKISVVMPAYREKPEQIKLAVESILNQTLTDFDYIIILDDPTNHELEALILGYASKDARIRFYINEKNSGCPFSKDRGVRLAETEYVAIMDADDVAWPQRLEKQLNKLEQEHLDIIAGYVRVIDDLGNPLYNMDNLPKTHEQICAKMKINNCMPHPTWCLRKSAYLKLNGYADMQGCEDYDFLNRAIWEGYKLGTVDEIILDYRLSSESVSRNSLYKQYLMFQYVQGKYYKAKWKYQDFDVFYKEKYTEKKAEKYSKASVLFERAVAAKAHKKYFGMLRYLLQSVLTSKEYAVKIYRYILQVI